MEVKKRCRVEKKKEENKEGKKERKTGNRMRERKSVAKGQKWRGGARRRVMSNFDIGCPI